MTPTPRTDARVWHPYSDKQDVVWASFARELECENTRLREALELAFSIPRMTDQQLAELIENCRKVIYSKP
jgi:hypothetical protein